MIINMRHKKWQALSLALLLGMPLIAQAAPQSKLAVAAENKSAGKKPVVVSQIQEGELLSTAIGDVDGDGREEKILLLGSAVVPKGLYRGDLYVVVKDVATGRLKGYLRPKACGGYGAYLTLADVTGNGVDNVVVVAPTGGSGGIVDYRILDFAGEQPEEIFTRANNHGVVLQARYLPDFKAELIFPDIRRSVILDLNGEKEMYVHLNAYNPDGSVKESGLRPYTQDLSGMLMLDVDNDGVDEVVTTQRLVGSTNADTLGFVRTVWNYKAGQWIEGNVQFEAKLYNRKTYSKGQTVYKPNYSVSGETISLAGNKISYPRFSKMSSGVKQWQINSMIENYIKSQLQSVVGSGTVELNYNLKYAGDNYFSMLFNGMKVSGNKNEKIMHSFNFNINEGKSVSLEDLLGKTGKFWDAVEIVNKEKNIAVTAKNYQGYYYDGTAIVVYNAKNQEVAVDMTALRTHLRENRYNQELLTNQSNAGRASKVEKTRES